MKHLKEEGKQFKNYLHVYYTIDVHFQQTNWPSGNHLETKSFYSGCHHLHGVKIKVSVTSGGIAVNISKSRKGLDADKVIMTDNLDTHQKLGKKTNGGRAVENNSPSKDKFPNEWAKIANKCYQSLQESYPMVLLRSDLE